MVIFPPFFSVFCVPWKSRRRPSARPPSDTFLAVGGGWRHVVLAGGGGGERDVPCSKKLWRYVVLDTNETASGCPTEHLLDDPVYLAPETEIQKYDRYTDLL